jgi:hypothetical protein
MEKASWTPDPSDTAHGRKVRNDKKKVTIKRHGNNKIKKLVILNEVKDLELAVRARNIIYIALLDASQAQDDKLERLLDSSLSYLLREF